MIFLATDRPQLTSSNHRDDEGISRGAESTAKSRSTRPDNPRLRTTHAEKHADCLEGFGPSSLIGRCQEARKAATKKKFLTRVILPQKRLNVQLISPWEELEADLVLFRLLPGPSYWHSRDRDEFRRRHFRRFVLILDLP